MCYHLTLIRERKNTDFGFFYSGAAYLIAQCGSIGSIFYCCDGDKSRQCCNDPKNDLRLPVADIAFFASAPTQDGASTPAIASIASSSTTKPAAQVSTSMTSLRTPTAQATSSVSSSTSADNTTYVVTPSISVSTSTDNTMIVVSQTERSPSSGAPQSLPTTFATDPELVSPSQSNNHTVIIGASAGSSVAAVVILLGVFTCIWLQRHPPEQEDQEAGVERAAVLRPSRRPAPASDWAESTLIDSHSHHLPLSRTNSHAQDAVELKSPTLRSQASSTHAPASPLRTPDQQSHSHFPPAELESSFDVAPIHVPFHAPSRPPPPPPVELEARDGVTVTALWRAGSPPNSSRKPPTLGSPLSTILQSPHSSIEQRSVVSPVVETPRESLSPEQERRQDPHESGGSHKPEQAIVPGRSPQSTASESRSRAGGSDGLA